MTNGRKKSKMEKLRRAGRAESGSQASRQTGEPFTGMLMPRELVVLSSQPPGASKARASPRWQRTRAQIATHTPGIAGPPDGLVPEGEGSPQVAASAESGQEPPAGVEGGKMGQGKDWAERQRQGPGPGSQGLHSLQGQGDGQEEVRAAQMERVDQAGGESQFRVGHRASDG